MLWAENLASIESEGRRLIEAVRRDPMRPVPQYPDWTLADLATHTAAIHARTIEIVTGLPTERIPAPTLPDGADPIVWYEESLDGMLAVLVDADPAQACWGFGPAPCVGTWETRMVAETGVHRWDAYQAFGEEDRLTDRVALVGLQEFPDVWLPRLGAVQTLGVTTTDPDLSFVFGGPEPSASVEGTASDVYLRLMSRPSPVELPDDWAAAIDGLAPPPKS